MAAIQELNLNMLKEGLWGVSKTAGAYHAEACLFCFDSHQHQTGVELEVKGDYKRFFRVLWDDPITEQIKRSWNDPDDATEIGACGIAFLLILALTDYTIIERSRKGTGFDYHLGYADTLIFAKAARLEVSGIFNASSENDIAKRVSQKLKQTTRSDGALPAYIVVVEFSKPVSHVVRK